MTEVDASRDRVGAISKELAIISLFHFLRVEYCTRSTRVMVDDLKLVRLRRVRLIKGRHFVTHVFSIDI